MDPPRRRGRRLVAVLAAVTIAGMATLGWTAEQHLSHRVAGLQRADAALRADLSREAATAGAAANGLNTRIGHLEQKFDAQPDPTAISKVVSASVFTVDAGEDLGSGWIIAPNGAGSSWLVTNFHVIADTWHAGQHGVRIRRDDLTYDGTISTVDQQNDLALISVPIPVPALRRATTAPQVGDPVLAVGSPLGLGGTVSSGIVSAMRTEDGHDYVQFSAPISPGNSGGPLVNKTGDVIGVSVAKMVADGAEGLSFAIPIATVCTSFGLC